MIKKALFGAAVAASLFALSAPASATLTNWYIDTDGPGGNPKVLVSDYLDLTGVAYVHNTFTTPTTFAFNEAGSFNVLSHDGGPPIGSNFNPALTAKFLGSGNGTTGGVLNFTPGVTSTLKVFSGATDIADFFLQAGSANLQAGTVLPNGAISFVFKATRLTAGYFFDSAMNDLSIVANSPTGLLLGFATTNVISLAGGSPPRTVDSTLINAYNTAFTPAVPTLIVANNTTDLYLSNNGQFRLQVPEPSMLSLLGLALVGAGFASRRKSKA